MSAIGSAVFNGSWTGPFKACDHLRVHPSIFTVYASTGVFLSSWLVLPLFQYNDDFFADDGSGTKFDFSPLGTVAGFLFVAAALCVFNAVNNLGVAMAQGIWGGVAILVSYLWGVVVFGDTPGNLVLSVLGVVVLIIGVVALAQCDNIAAHIIKTQADGEEVNRSLLGSQDGKFKCVAKDPENSFTTADIAINEGESDEMEQFKPNYVNGLFWACGVGLTGGSVLVPLHYVPSNQAGIVFLPSLGIGALISSLLFYLLDGYMNGQEHPWHVREAMLPGFFCGVLWNCGNFLSVIGISQIGYGVAYPILQCAIFVSGLWGIFYWKEIKRQSTIAIFFIGGTILIGGAIMLAVGQA